MKTKLISGAMACLLAVSLCSCGGGADTPLSSGRTTGNSQSDITNDGTKTNASTGGASEGGSTTKSDNTHTTANTRNSSDTTASTKKPGTGSLVSTTPQPIVFTESMQGNDISFQVGTSVDLRGGSQPWTSHVAVIRSYSELKTLYDQDENENKKDKGKNYISNYDESFFKDKALIVLFIVKGSLSESHKIDQITKVDNQLYIELKTKNPSKGLMAPGDFRTLITVNQSDISGLHDILVYNTEWK